MKIDVNSSRISADKVSREYAERLRENRAKEQASGRIAAPAPSDTVSISRDAKLLAKAKAAAEVQPDMRDKLVADIRDKVEAGRYSVDTDKLAEKMLES